MMLIFTSTLFFIVIVQVIFNAFFAESIYINTKEEEITQVYYKLIANYTPDAIEIYKKVRDYEDELNLRVFIYDSNLKVIYETLSNQITADLLTPYSLTQQGNLIKNFMWYPQANLIKSYRNDTQTLAVRGTIDVGNSINYIVLEIPLATIKQAVQTINQYTINLSLILLVVGSIIVYAFSSKLAKPIMSISKVAKNVANLNFEEKAPERNANDEISILAKNINFMACKLEKSIYELQIVNASLQKENELKQKVDNMRKEFVANVSHELKTPLSIMQGYAEMLKSDIPNLDKEYYFDVILDENKHMTELVSKLLNISKLENGLTELKYVPVDLVDVCKRNVTKNQHLIKDIKIVFNSSVKEAVVSADKVLIEQVFTNFLANAFNYTKGDIFVGLEKEGKVYRVAVFNEGDNISNEDLEKIWHSFYRADKARTRSKDKNFGLGLYIVRTIITAHKGDVGVYNTDNGVCFWFEINAI